LQEAAAAGSIVSDYWQRFGEYRAMAAPLVRNGGLKYREGVVEGLDRARMGIFKKAADDRG
jgi:NADPH-dependent curcumin reductase CurA